MFGGNQYRGRSEVQAGSILCRLQRTVTPLSCRVEGSTCLQQGWYREHLVPFWGRVFLLSFGWQNLPEREKGANVSDVDNSLNIAEAKGIRNEQDQL